MLRPDDCEVPPIQRRYSTDAESLCEGYDGCIHGSQRQIAISGYELCNPHPIAGEHGLCKKVSGSEISEESHFSFPAQTCLEEINDFGDHELRHE